MRRILRSIVLVLTFVTVGSYAQSGEDALLSADELLEARPERPGGFDFDLELDHYDNAGYPEDGDGLLVLRQSAYGPAVGMRDDADPFLLYAHYANRQRDAVFLARTGTITDVLPSGEPHAIPYGYGAVKFTTAYVSIVESMGLPHFSDNRKEYLEFPLQDLYVGASFALSELSATLRYVHRETYVGEIQIGVNTFGNLNPQSVLSWYFVPLHVGGGYRFPGMFPQFIGENVWTAGIDTIVGLGDRDGDPATSPIVVLPGLFFDIERILFDEAGLRRDYREDPRPYNYRVNSLSLRFSLYLNLNGLSGSAPVVVPFLSMRYQYNVLGPRIPGHEFKETTVLYLSDLYREDLERQKARREERSRESAPQ